MTAVVLQQYHVRIPVEEYAMMTGELLAAQKALKTVPIYGDYARAGELVTDTLTGKRTSVVHLDTEQAQKFYDAIESAYNGVMAQKGTLPGVFGFLAKAAKSGELFNMDADVQHELGNKFKVTANRRALWGNHAKSLDTCLKTLTFYRDEAVAEKMRNHQHRDFKTHAAGGLEAH